MKELVLTNLFYLLSLHGVTIDWYFLCIKSKWGQFQCLVKVTTDSAYLQEH